MALNFPANPVNGQTLTQGGLTFRYDSVSQSWEGVVRTQRQESPVFVSNSPPSSPMVGTLWYDLQSSTLFLRSYSLGVQNWVPITSAGSPLPPYVVVSATEPSNPAEGSLWYDSSTSSLKIRSGSSWILAFEDAPEPVLPTVVISSSAPSSPTDGSLWYNLNTEELYVWSLVSNNWVKITSPGNFVQTPPTTIADSAPISPENGYLWYQPTQGRFFVRSNDAWVELYTPEEAPPNASAIVSNSPPIDPEDGTLWFSLAEQELSVWSESTSQWNLISSAASSPNPIVTVSDSPPISPGDGELWVDSRDMDLHVYYDDGDTHQWVSLSAYSRNVFDEPIYANYSIPSAPNAFVTVEWVQERLGAEGSVPLSALSGKGSLISASAAFTVEEVPPGYEGTLLRRNDSSPSGIDWVDTLDGGNF